MPFSSGGCGPQDVLHMLEMLDIRDQVVGPPGTGLSPEQRKRLTLGVEVRVIYYV